MVIIENLENKEKDKEESNQLQSHHPQVTQSLDLP